MEKKMMKSNGAGSRSSAMKRRRLLSAAAVLLICCLVFVGAAGAAEDTTKPVAKNIDSGKTYTSIQEAVEKATSGDTILVTESHELDYNSAISVTGKNYMTLILVDEKDLTIDLNGCEVTTDFSTYSGNDIYSVIWVHSGAKLTLTDSSEGETGKLHFKTIETGYKIPFLLVNYNTENSNGCNMVIEGGTYMADFGEDSLVYAQGNEVTLVTGGTFYLGNVDTGDNGSPWIFNAKESDANRIVVTGGTFNADVNHKHWEYEVYVPKERALRDNGDGNWTVVDAVAYVTEYQTRHTWFNNNPDDIGGSKYERNVGYATVEDAVSNVGKHHASSRTDDFDQYTITLIKDADVTKTLEFGTSDSPLAKSTVFDMNGKKITWKGNTDHILTVSGEKLTINSFNIIREGYEYKWNKDGGVFGKLPVNDNDPVEVTQSLSIAAPEPNTYTVTFNANGGDGEMTQQPFTYDVEAELPENTFTRTGYQFNGWNTKADGSGTPYENKATVKNLTSVNGGTVTLYANWTAKSYTVTFNANGGSVTPESKTVTYGSSYGELPTPEWEGHTFKCWSQNSGGGMVFTEDVVVMSPNDHTLYAIWEENSAEGDVAPPSSGGGGDGGHLSFPRTTENGGLVDFGSSKVVKALMLPEGSSGSVLLKVDTVEKWPKALETEYTFDISVEKLGEGMAYIHFEIPVSVLESLELTPADICAYHFEGEVWTKLPTTYEVKDGTVCYEAETDSFSPFKLVIEEGAATQKEEENVPTVPPTEEPDVPDEPEILPPIDEPTKPADEPETPAPILAVLAGLGAAFIVRRK